MVASLLIVPAVVAVAVSVGVSAVAGCGGTPTPPLVASLPPNGPRYIVGGDSRSDGAHVVPWAFREAKARQATAFIFLGDMELTPALDSHFQDELAALDPIPFYPALGNHEVRLFGFFPVGHDGAERAFKSRFLDSKRTPVTSSLEGRVVYSADLPGGLHFVALDNVSQKGFGKEQLDWLAADLDKARANAAVHHIMVGMHEALAHNGITGHGMDADGDQAVADSEAALALFVKAKVDLIVASHAHQFATFTIGGIPGYITGGLGAPLDKVGPEHAFHHFLQLDVSETEIKVTVVRFEGAPLFSNGEEDD
jgi:3',5'-cyclic AMP phosphodiesterase CpdA